MNPVHPHDDTGFDAQARGLHRASLAQVSPQTLMRLRTARHEAQRAAPAGGARSWRWLTATAFSAVLAVGIGVQFLPRMSTAPAPGAANPVAVTDGEASLDEATAGTLEEDPDLYLWLASADAQPLAME
jgi:anti-sigma-K factor RskA